MMMIRLFLLSLVLFCFSEIDAQNKIAASSGPDSAATSGSGTPQLAATSVDSVNVVAPRVEPKLAPYAQDAPADPKQPESPLMDNPRKRK